MYDYIGHFGAWIFNNDNKENIFIYGAIFSTFMVFCFFYKDIVKRELNIVEKLTFRAFPLLYFAGGYGPIFNSARSLGYPLFSEHPLHESFPVFMMMWVGIHVLMLIGAFLVVSFVFYIFAVNSVESKS